MESQSIQHTPFRTDHTPQTMSENPHTPSPDPPIHHTHTPSPSVSHVPQVRSHRDIFRDFIPDDRMTVSDDPTARRRTNKQISALLQSCGSKSDSGVCIVSVQYTSCMYIV
ncbi:hypothetical protein EON63_23365 [archaeon]|nr:MAG: hypothetical protein EON63_23365 [archaeon]